MIELVAYDPSWPQCFAVEAQRLHEAFGARARRVEHVGSTAVPGLAAKPVIDIQVSVDCLAPLAPLASVLATLGYTHVPDPDDAFERVYPFFCRPASWPSTHHVHLCGTGSAEEARHLRFRDALRADAGLAAAYLALKRSLAAAHGGMTHEERVRYAMGKSEFVEGVLARALRVG